MAVEKAPYMNYTEITSYQEYIDNGSEVPVFLVKTDNDVKASDITSDNVQRFMTYGKFAKEYNITGDEEEYASLDESIKELNVILKNFFEENNRYDSESTYGLTVPYVYVIDVGNKPNLDHYKNALSVSERKRNSTVVVFPSTEDAEFMNEVKQKLMEETKSGLLRIAYFAISGEGELPKMIKGNVIRPSINYHGFANIVNGKLVETEDNSQEDNSQG